VSACPQAQFVRCWSFAVLVVRTGAQDAGRHPAGRLGRRPL